ncbi:MAG: hypothetical protein MR993_02010 [Spirochaetes bacterium]|nr:hypothetical protein [Spirochaetota bacterium]
MNIQVQLAQFFDSLEQQRRDNLNNLPVNGYTSTQELFKACATWIDLENGPFYANGYKEYFENIIANLKHENSQHLALALFIKLNDLNKMQLFLLLRLLARMALGATKWDTRMETYLDRGKAVFTQGELDSLFIGQKEEDIRFIGNVLQYNQRTIGLNRSFVYVRQFLGILPPVRA